MRINQLKCGYCGNTTDWPVENDVEMMVYGTNHVANECDAAPPDARAEAIVYLAEMRAGRFPS